jgi:predicted RNase H-like HicB family nuclease
LTEYALHLESGPRRRKTMVHVLALLGCIAQGPTTEAALEATPEAIRNYLRFLRQHGEAAEPEAAFTTVVAEHVTEGVWLGNGDPTPGFSPDFEPLTVADLAVYRLRLDWLCADLLRLVGGLSPAEILAEPEGSGRPIYRIYEHLVESQATYLRMLVGKVEGLPEAAKHLRRGPEGIEAGLSQVWSISQARLERLSELERAQMVSHGQVVWTARRAIRRMLEHSWEHLLEVSWRLDASE